MIISNNSCHQTGRFYCLLAQLAITRISSGVVRQHPPIRRAPASYHSLACSPKESKTVSPVQSFSIASYVSPELGYARMGLFVTFLASRINDEIYFGDVQLIPIASICGLSSSCFTQSAKA